jgi:hypothetical protein
MERMWGISKGLRIRLFFNINQNNLSRLTKIDW